ncbi:alpha/beta hydrolase [Clostridium aminobutyricum]|uniref:Alpha/beta hydrolase n=1 Tax=Clostridium aminobutyricum TaxID=33953 RepID=A0A939IGP1_CLOAM|nr:alpha/beta hydrolase [Clostridium aminobutyricum]MBN7772227.1 alpha/beta hydrolase [Clostridium aminobutyricum]
MTEYIIEKKKAEELQQADYEAYAVSELEFPLLSQQPDKNRIDYFDIAYGKDGSNKLDIHHLKGAVRNPVIVFIHGGGWARRDKDQSRFVAPSLLKEGYTVVSINYRLTGSLDENAIKIPHPAQIEDCAAALKWVTENIETYGGDPNNIMLLGHSAGAHLTALLIGDTRWHQKYQIDFNRIKGWIGLSGIYDLTLEENYAHEWMPVFIRGLIDKEEEIRGASPIEHIKGTEPPCLLIHGRNDYLVPITNSIHLFDRLSEKRSIAQLEMIDGIAHMDYFSRLGDAAHPVYKAISQFLRKIVTQS